MEKLTRHAKPYKTPEEVDVSDLLAESGEPGCFGKNGTYWDRPGGGRGGGGGGAFASIMEALQPPSLSTHPWEYSTSRDGNWGSSSAAEAGASGLFDMWL